MLPPHCFCLNIWFYLTIFDFQTGRRSFRERIPFLFGIGTSEERSGQMFGVSEGQFGGGYNARPANPVSVVLAISDKSDDIHDIK